MGWYTVLGFALGTVTGLLLFGPGIFKLGVSFSVRELINQRYIKVITNEDGEEEIVPYDQEG